MNNSTSYSEYKPSTDKQQFNVFWDEFLPESNEFTNARARNNNVEINSFLYEARSLAFPASPANYETYIFGTSPNQRQWMAYNGAWIEIGFDFAFPYVKTKQEVWLNGIEDFYWKARPNYTGDNAYVKNSSAWRYGNVVGTSVTPGYSNVAGGNWHPVDWPYSNSLAEGVGYTLRAGVTFFNYPSIIELKEVIIKERRSTYTKYVSTSSTVSEEDKKLPIEEFNETNLLGTVTSSAFNVSDQSIDLPGSISSQLENDELVYLVPKFAYIENNEGKPITTSPKSTSYIVGTSYDFYQILFNDRSLVFDYDSGGGTESSTRIVKSFVSTSAASFFYKVVLKNSGAGKLIAKKTIQKILWDRYRKYYSVNTGYRGQYAYDQSLFDNPAEVSPNWLSSSGSNMEFNVYRVKVNSTWQTGDEVSLIPARPPAEHTWSDWWGGSDGYNYFSWLDSRYVNLDTNEITVQSEGYIEDFKTGTEVEVVGASNVIQGGSFTVVKQIFKTNQVLTATSYSRYFITTLDLSYNESILLTGQNDTTQNGYYYVARTSPVVEIYKDFPKFDRSTFSYYGGDGNGYYGSNLSQASAPTSVGHVDGNIEAWRLDLYICVLKDYSEGHSGELTVYKQTQPWDGLKGLPGVEQVVTAKQRKRLQSFYGNYNDGGFQGPTYLYNTGYTPSANNGWYAGSRYFASTFTEIPDGLEEGGRYHLIRNGNKIKFAASYDDAVAGYAIPLKSVGKGAILIYRAKGFNTKALSKIDTIDGVDVTKLLPPSQSCFLIKKNNGRFQLAATKAKALTGEALRLVVEPNTFLKLEQTTFDTQTGKYIWNPQETTALEPLNQKTGQVFYDVIYNAQAQYVSYGNSYPAETVAADFIQGYKIRINLNLPEYDPLKMVDTNAGTVTSYTGEGVTSPQYFKDGWTISDNFTRTMYPSVLPDPPTNTTTIDGIELTPVVDVAAHWSPIIPSVYFPYSPAFNYISNYVATTWKITYANNKAVADNMMTKALAYLATQDLYLDRNTTDEQIRYTIFGGGNYNQYGLAGRFTDFFNEVWYPTKGPISYDGTSTIRSVKAYEFFFGGITTSTYFKTNSHIGTTSLTTVTSGDVLYPGSTTVYSRYKSETTQGATTFVDSEGTTFLRLRLAVMYAVQKTTGDEYLSVIVLPITGSDGAVYNGIYINNGEQKTYKKNGNVFIAVTSSGGMLPNQLTLGSPYKLFDSSKNFNLDFSSQVIQTWRKNTMVADKVNNPSYSYNYSDKINKLSQLTVQDYQQNPSDFSGPVVCSYKPAKKIWSSNPLSSNGIPFKIEIVPKLRIAGGYGFGYSYYYSALSYSYTTASISIYSTPNVFKGFQCLTATKIQSYDPLDSTYIFKRPDSYLPYYPYTVTSYEPVVTPYSSNKHQKTGPAILELPESITAVAGENGPTVYQSSQIDSNTFNNGIVNNGYELLIAEDTIKSSGSLVVDDIFKASWGHIIGLFQQQPYNSYTYIQWAELWDITGTTKINTLDPLGSSLLIFKNKPSVEIVSQYGSGGKIELNFTEGTHAVTSYLNKPGFRYEPTLSKIIKSGKHYFSGAATHTPQNFWFSGSTYQDYIKVSGTAYSSSDGSEIQIQYRLSFKIRWFDNSSTKFPWNRNPSESDYALINSSYLFVPGNTIYFYGQQYFTAPNTYTFLAKGVDGETFMPGCPGPIAISHLTKVSIQ